ncbi:MAG TPA: response regulator, partial [Verrucomicrobiae bacterium]|nr:response regulator [Verrucomicrobiae bacterium]
LLGNGHSATAAQKAEPAQPQSAPATAPSSEADVQSGLLDSFRSSLPATLVGVRAQLQTLFRAGNEELRLKQVQELYRRIHILTGNAAVVGMLRIAQVADALEALLKELYEKPKNINASTLRTVASTVDFLAVLAERGMDPANQEIPTANILVVDDEAISRRAITHALEKAKLKCSGSEDPNKALDMLKATTYDMVILDVDMPGMNGFELCAKLRALPAYKKTPVVFVTGLNDFESRANSTMSGGNDFIAKPFLFMELAVKALVFILRGKLG